MPLNEDDLMKSIVDEMKKVLMFTQIVDADGNLVDQKIFPFRDTLDESKVMLYRENGEEINNKEDARNDEKYTGFEILIKVLINKIMEHILSNIENNLLQRFDLLESDLDSFVKSMLGVGVGPATAVPAAVTAWIATSNQVQRLAAKENQDKNITKPYIHGSK